jgi:large subunit ribosomal protein L25
MELTVEGQKRPEGSKPNALRQQGQIPAVVYGHNGAESINLTIAAKTVERLLKEGSVNNTLIQLNIPDISWSGKTLLREVQTHPWKGFPYHLSFFAISAQESVEVQVALNFVGEAVGVKLEGCILDPVMTEVTVRCKPDSIPEKIDVNVSELHRGGAVHISELVLPEGVAALADPGQVVVNVVLPSGEAGEGAAAPA